MDSEQSSDTEPSGQFENLHTITPLSKYLAMALFVVMPFLGGWIGYTYAPEKIVYVEKVAYKSLEPNELAKSEHHQVLNEGISTNDSETLEASTTKEVQFNAQGIEQWESVSIGGNIYDETNGQYDRENSRSILSYSASTFFINGQPVYTASDGTYEYFQARNGHFLRLGEQIYGMRPVGLASSELIDIPLARAENFKSIGNGYATDAENIFYVTEATPLNLDANQYEFIDMEIASDPIMVSGNSVYYRGKHLSNLSYDEIQIGVHDRFGEGYYLRDNDSIYFYIVQCHTGGFYKEGSFEEIATWRMGC